MKCNIEVGFLDSDTGYVNVAVPDDRRGDAGFINSCHVLVRDIAHSVSAHLNRVTGSYEWVAHTSELSWYDRYGDEIDYGDEQKIATVQCQFYR